MRQRVLEPLGMTNSTFDQPPPPARDRAARTRAHGRARRWRTVARLSRAGRGRTVDHAHRPRALRHRGAEAAVRGRSARCCTQASAREMTAPVGAGPFAVGLAWRKRGEGWYFSHGGSNWGFQADVVGHLRKGYGVAMMTNGDRRPRAHQRDRGAGRRGLRLGLARQAAGALTASDADAPATAASGAGPVRCSVLRPSRPGNRP